MPAQRREVERVIQKPAKQAFADQTVNDLANILASAGQLGAQIANAKAQEVRASASAAQAEKRLEQANRELGIDIRNEELRQDKAQFALDSDISTARKRLELEELSNDNQSFKRFAQLQEEGLPALINNLSDEQLREAVASKWGVTAPTAVREFNKLTGVKRAQADLPALERLIAESPGEDPVDLARTFAESQQFATLEQRASYLDSLDRYVTAKAQAFASEDVNRAKEQALQVTSNDIQFAVMSKFSWLTADDVQGIADGALETLRTVDPRATEADAIGFMVNAIKPLFVGPEARFTSNEALRKLEYLFPEGDKDNLAAQGMIQRLREEQKRELAQGSSGLRTEVKRKIEGSETMSELEETLAFVNALEDSGQIADYDGNIFRTQLREQFGKVRADEEVLRGAQGAPIAAYTDSHHDAIERLSDEMGLAGANRTSFQVSTYGVVTDATLERISSNALAADIPNLPDEERVARLTAALTSFKGISDTSPSYARRLTAEGNVPRKLAVLSNLASMTGQNVDLLIAQHVGVPESAYARADAILSSGETQDGKEIRAENAGKLTRQALFDLTNRLGKDLDYGDANLQRVYLDALSANVALQLTSEGDLDPKDMFRRADAAAMRLLKANVQPVKIGGDNYPVFRDEVAAYGFNDDETLENVNRLFKKHKRDVQQLLPGASGIRLDFGARQIVTTEYDDGKGGKRPVKVLRVPIVANNEFLPAGFEGTAFDIPLNVVDLKIQARGAANNRPATEQEIQELLREQRQIGGFFR